MTRSTSLRFIARHAVLAALFTAALPFAAACGQEDPSANKDDYSAAMEQAEQHWADSKGDWPKAYAEARRASQLAKQQFGKESLEYAAAQTLEGTVVLYMGRPAEAEKICRRAYEIRKAKCKEGSVEPLESAVRLAHCLNNLNRFPESEKLCREWLAFYNTLGKRDEPLQREYLARLGRSLMRQRKGATGEKVYRVLLPLEDRLYPDDLEARAVSYQRLANCINMQKRQAEAETFVRQSLALYRQHEKKAQTRLSKLQLAGSLWNLGANLHAQTPRRDDRLREAIELLEESLAVRDALNLPPDNRERLQTMFTLSYAAFYLRDHEKAQAVALDIWERRKKHQGATHPDALKSLKHYTSLLQDNMPLHKSERWMRLNIRLHQQAYGDADARTRGAKYKLARKLDHADRYVEALELRHELLKTVRRIYGEYHAETASCYNALGLTLGYQNKNAEAARMIRRAVAISERLGNNDTLGYGIYLQNLSGAVSESEGAEEAIKLARKALEIHERRINEPFANPAIIKNSLAAFLAQAGKDAEAEEIYHELLAHWQKTGGPTTIALRNLAVHRIRAHDFVTAEKMLRKLLASSVAGNQGASRGTEGGLTYRYMLAISRYFQGDIDEAIQLLEESERHYADLRSNWALTGLDQALTTRQNPSQALAVLYASQGRVRQAWEKWEATRALGLLDELAFRSQQQLSQAERQQRASLLEEIRETESRLPKAKADERTKLLSQLDELQEKRFAIERLLMEQAGSGRSELATLDELQAWLPDDAAMIGWLDPFPTHAEGLSDDHWAVVVRKRGEPVWIKLPGRGDNNAWTAEDRRLRVSVAREMGRYEANASTAKYAELAQLRIDPLRDSLEAQGELPKVKQLIVVPSKAMLGVSLQALAADYSVSYSPSSTVYVLLAKRTRQRDYADRPSLLAVADPIFSRGAPQVASSKSEPEKQTSGLLLTQVAPSVSKATGLRMGDVLIEVDGRNVQSKTQLDSQLAKRDASKPIRLAYLRENQRHQASLPGKLDVTFSPLPFSEVKKLEADIALTLRSANADEEAESLPELPGTRREVSALESVITQRGGETQLLIGPEATESKLKSLNESNELTQFRYVHLATHGLVNAEEPMRSALILSPEEADAVGDRRLTAGEMLSNWKLNAELVTLSACQTALGRYAEGEGHIGFAQSLLLAGADSVLLSLWKVDDAATALLMQRFYQNLLGTRDGLDEPMPKHAALHEAQLWLRDLPASEAGKLIDGLPQLTRGKKTRRDRAPLKKPPVVEDRRPYADPFFWSGFVLVGHGQ